MIGKNLQILRKKRGLTQKELADAIGLTREAVAAYESGRGHILDVTLISLAAALHASADQILGIKAQKTALKDVSLRITKRMKAIDSLPETTKKHILKTIDDSIKANRPA